MTARQWLVPALAGIAAGAAFIGIPWAGVTLIDDPPPAPTTTTTTTQEPFCVGESLVIPNTGVVDFAPRCDIPPQHAPPNTGPTTGPNGEVRQP